MPNNPRGYGPALGEPHMLKKFLAWLCRAPESAPKPEPVKVYQPTPFPEKAGPPRQVLPAFVPPEVLARPSAEAIRAQRAFDRRREDMAAQRLRDQYERTRFYGTPPRPEAIYPPDDGVALGVALGVLAVEAAADTTDDAPTIESGQGGDFGGGGVSGSF